MQMFCGEFSKLNGGKILFGNLFIAAAKTGDAYGRELSVGNRKDELGMN